MDRHTTENEVITACLKELKLSAIKDQLEDIIAEATEYNWDIESSFTLFFLMRLSNALRTGSIRKYVKLRSLK